MLQNNLESLLEGQSQQQEHTRQSTKTLHGGVPNKIGNSNS